ncbi:MAG: methionyl-tRNA formyltransferase [Deltaproteobacteria bacterium RIFCSPLOWO2_12_FULL_43_16]|nr:MAG: methionyl-tRNA formyltransferase [Deltaproteobacteria bacterium GWA2_43_19]OGQ10257.1 MAG: methionyl-tRNA formyltransferase [Deltaproteobacteria bacterium RIFCSPHIGHO2_02_FULL_43_33]OGQ44743.1 MAG: methionyl-tRNA formyltransferase [Deltaproteobacteria bacterium RIFCSPLOWO2_01_FULL_42_9]OGQ57605.1 MAG: methionyl-tRNA formyltransferase [Deltaproteobacteria bacterium RIFCSPLOWO2_12_FULL_43_16]HBR17715.1 methionyl-tRNA formyltransferase [Deltaproteobacteria bacterium]
MGTPEFAAPSLKTLIAAGEDVAAVVTQPDKPKGRGKHLSPPPVKELALKYNIPVLQPEKIRDEAFINIIQKLRPDIIVVIAYGKILPKAILDIPPKGCINVHASLLPKYRGAAPINWAIINGEKETGITTMLMDEGMDTGDILLTERVEIQDNDTTDSVYEKLKDIGANLLIKTISGLKKGMVRPIDQDDSYATYAPMLKKEDGRIDWAIKPEEIRNLIRGMYPWPGAYTRWEGKQLKIFKAQVASEERTSEEPGVIIKTSTDGIYVATGAGILLITELQPENKSKMSASEFIKGYKIGKGQIFD